MASLKTVRLTGSMLLYRFRRKVIDTMTTTDLAFIVWELSISGMFYPKITLQIGSCFYLILNIKKVEMQKSGNLSIVSRFLNGRNEASPKSVWHQIISVFKMTRFLLWESMTGMPLGIIKSSSPEQITAILLHLAPSPTNSQFVFYSGHLH